MSCQKLSFSNSSQLTFKSIESGCESKMVVDIVLMEKIEDDQITFNLRLIFDRKSIDCRWQEWKGSRAQTFAKEVQLAYVES